MNTLRIFRRRRYGVTEFRVEPLYRQERDGEGTPWHGLMEVLIKRADLEDRAKLAQSSSEATGSLADELRKLADLRDAGVLDAEEFQREKARLLA